MPPPNFGPNQAPPPPDTPIAIKVTYEENTRKFWLTLKDLAVPVFVDKVRSCLKIPADRLLHIQRFSDSYGQYVTVDPAIPASYKQLYRAAKAKSKLRLTITVTGVVGQENSTSSLEQGSSNANVETPDVAKYIPQNPSLHDQPSKESQSSKMNGSRPQSVIANAKNEGATRSTSAFETPFRPAIAQSVMPAAGLGFQICCNNCDKHITDAHFHCDVCHKGDYDLCESCVAKGITCPGDDHWLIKRFIKNGDVVTSHTESYSMKFPKCEKPDVEMPGAFQAEAPKPASNVPQNRRTCNACVRGHTFKRVDEKADISAEAKSLCGPGRGVRHHAICDGCDKTISGVRHKCLDCPDFDFCNECISSGRMKHSHRFVRVYEPLEGPSSHATCHYGIYCDGPLCLGPNQAYIRGIRYKCAICNDTDFCGSCEAHPSNTHSKTHPLIKFKTMVRDVSVLTLDQTAEEHGAEFGDRRARPKTSSQDAAESKKVSSDTPQERPQTLQPNVYASGSSSGLNAEYISDTVRDGSSMPCGAPFTQTWIVRNSGPKSWPAGCTLHHIGGDSMLDLDHDKPASVDDLMRAMSSSCTSSVVNPGFTHHFQVSLRAPVQPGRYISYWRVKSADGEAFGHKLWCDIRVPQPGAGTAPSKLSHGMLPAGAPPQSARQELHKVIPVRPGRPASEFVPPFDLQSGPNFHGVPGMAPAYSNPSPSCLSQPSAASSTNHTYPKVQGLDQNTFPRPDVQSGLGACFTGFPSDPSTGALADYQMQLMLLEQQNKRRLLMARQEQEIQQPAKSAEVPKKEEAKGLRSSPAPEAPVAAPEVKPANEGDAMVFPTLEKESPSSSTLEGEEKAVDNAKIESSAATIDETAVPKSSNDALTDLSAKTAKSEKSIKDEPDYQDVEDMSFSDSDGEGEDFLTDEEYDILDASDEEFSNGGVSTTA
ncbi:MAG: hypothetical protein M1831_004947 [Alyxoria varia]|nr:MAG: hypothetical protein M1831_004947 [Alyxoria varia]